MKNKKTRLTEGNIISNNKKVLESDTKPVITLSKDNMFEKLFETLEDVENNIDDTYEFMDDAEIRQIEAIGNFKNNPIMLDYIIKSLDKQGFGNLLSNNKAYAVVCQHESRPEYNKDIFGSFENYQKNVINTDFGLKKYEHIINHVFLSIDEIEDFMIGYKGDIKFQKYTIKRIGK